MSKISPLVYVSMYVFWWGISFANYNFCKILVPNAFSLVFIEKHDTQGNVPYFKDIIFKDSTG